MQVIETIDPMEAQRCRRAQYSGSPATVAMSGSTIFGLVRSVQKAEGSRWIVTITPKEQNVFALPRYKPSYTG